MRTTTTTSGAASTTERVGGRSSAAGSAWPTSWWSRCAAAGEPAPAPAAATAVARSAVAAGSAGDLIDRINNYVMGHLVMDDLTAIVVRRTG